MTTSFQTLYDLAIELQVNPDLQKLTFHNNGLARDDVEARLRRSILTLNMQDEQAGTPWDNVRVFCRNLVNRAQPAVRDNDVKNLLRAVEGECDSYHARIKALPVMAATMLRGNRAEAYVRAVRTLTSDRVYSELGGTTLLEWLDQRWLYWVNKSVESLNVDELLSDIDVLSEMRSTKIEGMGLPLAANFFADIGLPAFAKPDLHVTPIINILLLQDGARAAFRGIVKIAQIENEILSHNKRFSWLAEFGGLYPRYLDRVIYLIGSDNFNLDGVKKKREAPTRRKMMRDALIEAGLVQARYSKI